MRLVKTLFAVILALFLVTAVPSDAEAKVGLINIRSTTSEEYRCFASSLIMPDKTYNVAVNCANLIYPPLVSEVSAYVLWANPTAGSPVKLGDLGKGEARFQVRQQFNSVFVTIEPNVNVKNPGTNVIMRGNVDPITFLQRPTSPTPTLEPVKPSGSDENPATNTSNLSTRDKLLLALRRAGIAAIIALVAIVGLIFVVTRSRG